jgi:hypothetical protein
MAFMQKGLMGGFTGRIGDKIGYVVNGVQYVRSAPKKRSSPVSTEQKIQREKFSLMTKFLSPLASFINEVHKYHNHRKTGYSKLFPLNYREALTGQYPDFGIDHHRIRLTTGSLSGPVQMHVYCSGRGVLNFNWKDNSCGERDSSPFDLLYLAFYDEDKKSWEIRKNIALREDNFLTIHMDDHRGNLLQIYSGFISGDKRRVSNSHYLGMINVL